MRTFLGSHPGCVSKTHDSIVPNRLTLDSVGKSGDDHWFSCCQAALCRGRSVAVSTPTLLPQGQHKLRRDKSRKEQHRRVAQRVSTRVPWSGSISLINRTRAIRQQNSPAFEKCKPPDFLQFITEATEAQILESGKSSGAHETPLWDAYHLTLRVQGLDAVKHHARSNSHGQVVRTRHDEHQVEGSSLLKNRAKPLIAFACCNHDEPSILVFGHLHGRQYAQATHSHVHVSELPAQSFTVRREK